MTKGHDGFAKAVDVFKIARGQKKAPSVVWIILHSLVASIGIGALGVW